MSHEGLLATAAELGISPEAVEAAEKQVTAQRLDQRLRAEFDAIRRREYYGHLAAFLLMNTFFLVLSMNHGYWVIWPFMFWGMGMVVHTQATFNKKGREYEECFESWKSRRTGQDQGEPSEFRNRPQSLTIGVHVGSSRRERHRRRFEERMERHVK